MRWYEGAYKREEGGLAMDGVVKAEWNVTYKRIVMPGEGYTGGNKPTNGYEIVTGIYDCKPYTIYRGTNIITSMVRCTQRIK